MTSSSSQRRQAPAPGPGQPAEEPLILRSPFLFYEAQPMSSSGVAAANYIVFWHKEDQILGLTDGRRRVWQRIVQKTERFRLLGVAESIVEEQWRHVFAKNSLRLAQVGATDAKLIFGSDTNFLLLPELANEEAAHEIHRLLFLFVRQHREFMYPESKPTSSVQRGHGGWPQKAKQAQAAPPVKMNTGLLKRKAVKGGGAGEWLDE